MRQFFITSILLVLSSIPSYAQISFLGKGIETSGGTELFIDYSTLVDEYEIKHLYSVDLIRGEGSYFTAIEVKRQDLEEFKNSFISLLYKYQEWIEIAKKNSVKEVVKEIPIIIRPVSLSFSVCTYPSEVSIKPYFRVHGGYYSLGIELRCRMTDGTYFTDMWSFKNPEDLQFILEDFDYVYQERTKDANNNKRTEDLFH